MKGSGGGTGNSAFPLPAKRRWRGPVIGVLGLVVLSMLVPLVFLLGLHTGLYSSSGYGAEQRNSGSTGLKVYDRHDGLGSKNQSKGKSTPIDELIRKLGPTLPKGFRKDAVEEADNKTIGPPVPADVQKQRPRANKAKLKDSHDTTDSMKSTDESQTLCESRFGSYCLWRQENTEKMNDSMVKKMKDLLYVARAYYPSIAKLPKLDKLTNEMKQNIQEFERILSETTTDKDLPPQIENKLNKMEAVIQTAKSKPVDCNNVDKKFRQLVDLTEDETNFHMKQSAFLHQLAVQTMPKSLHCLSMRLTVEYFRSYSPDVADSLSERHMNAELQHYVIFSNNVLASSVVINSTVFHTKEAENQVFHVLTDRENFFAMKMWFSRNTYKEAVVQVLNIEELELNGHNEIAKLHLSLPEEFRISFHKINKLSAAGIRTEYISVFSHLHYLLPILFPTLKKVVVLDDDVVIQKDLSSLWSLNMDGKVNGAIQFCAVKLGQLKNYLGEESVNEDSCAWMSGINVVDLVRWRQHNLTKTYQSSLQKKTASIKQGPNLLSELESVGAAFKLMNTREGLSDTSTLAASMLTFQGEIYALDDEWALSGLGHNYGLDIEAIEKAPVLHFNGNMKPWLELGISEYTKFWSKYLNQDNKFLRDCNVNTVKS